MYIVKGENQMKNNNYRKHTKGKYGYFTKKQLNKLFRRTKKNLKGVDFND